MISQAKDKARGYVSGGIQHILNGSAILIGGHMSESLVSNSKEHQHETHFNYILLGLCEFIQGLARILSLGFYNPDLVAWFLFTYLED